MQAVYLIIPVPYFKWSIHIYYSHTIGERLFVSQPAWTFKYSNTISTPSMHLTQRRAVSKSMAEKLVLLSIRKLKLKDGSYTVMSAGVCLQVCYPLKS